MGSITARRRKNGSTGYTAQIRLKRDGILVHTETETFSSKALARAWMTRREADLNTRRARDEPMGKRMTVGDMVAWYERRERKDEPWGRMKKGGLARLKTCALKDKRVDMLTRGNIIAYIDGRRDAGAGPATALNDLLSLRQVFKSASAVLDMPIPLHRLDAATEYLRAERTIARSNQRIRRLTPNEETMLLSHFDNRRSTIPMGAIVRFALLTARRQGEITRLRWDDLDRSKGIAKLRDVKHPTKKIGNDKMFRILTPAWELIEKQPRITRADGSFEPFIFSCIPKSVSAAFVGATRFLGIEDLHFHDLRHEATSRFFEKGYSIQEVAQLTLHESWMTLKRYTHLKPENVVER